MSFDARLLSGVGVMVAVVENGGFARAADQLGMRCGVSRAIARLESHWRSPFSTATLAPSPSQKKGAASTPRFRPC